MRFICQLRSPQLQQESKYPSIVVVNKEPVNLEAYKLGSRGEYFRFVEVVVGDPSDPDVLKGAGVPSAKSVIILAENRLGTMSDLNSLMTLRGVLMSCGVPVVAGGLGEEGESSGQPSTDYSANKDDAKNIRRMPSVVLECVESVEREEETVQKIAIPKEFKPFSDKLTAKLECLPVQKVRSMVFADAAKSMRGGLISALEGLLTYQEGKPRVYFTNVVRRPEWRHFSEVILDFINEYRESKSQTSNPIIPLSIRKPDEVDTNPEKLPITADSKTVLRLAVLAYSPPDPIITLRIPKKATEHSQHPASQTLCEAIPHSERREERAMTTELIRRGVMEDHYIVCHWNDRATEIIRQLRRYDLFEKTITGDTAHRTPVVVLTRKTNSSSMLFDIAGGTENEENSAELIQVVYFRPDDPTEPDVLRQVNVAHARKCYSPRRRRRGRSPG